MSEFRNGRRVLFAAMIGVGCGASPLPFNVLPAVIGPIHAELGWSFLQISLGITLFGIVASLLAPVYGWASDLSTCRAITPGDGRYAHGLRHADCAHL